VRRLVLLLAGSILLVAGPVSANAGPSKATLTIRAVAPGDPVGIEFRSMGLVPDSFVVPDGGEQVFANLKPGRYVVVQAPPRDGWDLRVQCSDGESSNQYDLTRGERLVCTFTSERL
jgi:hypothetical protein